MGICFSSAGSDGGAPAGGAAPPAAAPGAAAAPVAASPAAPKARAKGRVVVEGEYRGASARERKAKAEAQAREREEDESRPPPPAPAGQDSPHTPRVASAPGSGRQSRASSARSSQRELEFVDFIRRNSSPPSASAAGAIDEGPPPPLDSPARSRSAAASTGRKSSAGSTQRTDPEAYRTSRSSGPRGAGGGGPSATPTSKPRPLTHAAAAKGSGANGTTKPARAGQPGPPATPGAGGRGGASSASPAASAAAEDEVKNERALWLAAACCRARETARAEGAECKLAVCARIRPFLPGERGAACIEVEDDSLLIAPTSRERAQGFVHSAFAGRDTSGGRKFDVDEAFKPSASQDKLYRNAVLPVLSKFAEGYNACIIAYGQTGTGKTYTMLGKAATRKKAGPRSNPQFRKQAKNPPAPKPPVHVEEEGVAPRALRDLLDTVQALKANGIAATLTASFVQIHKDKLSDLLLRKEGLAEALLSVDDVETFSYAGSVDTGISGFSTARSGSGSPDRAARPRLDVRQDVLRKGMYVKGAREVRVASEADVYNLLEVGFEARLQGASTKNPVSSRSHAILTLYLRTQERDDPEGISARCSKLHLIDLAGSEKTDKVGGTAAVLEASSINQSLSALAAVIKDLSVGRRPTYRASKLTRLLQDSLGANAFTVFMCCLSANVADQSESLATLRFGTLASMIESRPRPAVDGFTELRVENFQLRQRIEQLESLMAKENEPNAPRANGSPRAAGGKGGRKKVREPPGGDKQVTWPTFKESPSGGIKRQLSPRGRS